MPVIFLLEFICHIVEAADIVCTVNLHIDIIACDRRYIVFTEVKTRDVNFVVSGKEAVDYAKRKKTVVTAKFFLSKNRVRLQPRFDVAEVYMKDGEVSSFNYIKNAYQDEEK